MGSPGEFRVGTAHPIRLSDPGAQCRGDVRLDEYELLREGYVYGYEDVVRAQLVVESLWFRNWTEKLMPKIVKQKLLIIKPQAAPLSSGMPEGF